MEVQGKQSGVGAAAVPPAENLPVGQALQLAPPWPGWQMATEIRVRMSVHECWNIEAGAGDRRYGRQAPGKRLGHLPCNCLLDRIEYDRIRCTPGKPLTSQHVAHGYAR